MRFNFRNINLGNKKLLYTILGVVVLAIATLTIAYAALSATLTISGSSEVVASTWDIHLENPVVKSGSVSTTVPTITNGNSLSFSTTLTTPGDYYEFTVDVVNDGSIDAMIDSVVKTPELTEAQAKYLKYEITYQNGESINTKQNIAAGATTPIKVRLEYRNDLSASDLPTTADTLSLSLTLVYVQSDGTGSDVKDNGAEAKVVSANGDISVPGTIVTIGDQQFYTIGTEGDNVKLLSMYNLYVGNSVDEDWNVTPLTSPTGKQSELARGWVDGATEWYGTTAFSNADSTYAGSIVEGYVNNYKTILESDYGVDVVEARLISYDELTDEEIGCSTRDYSCTTSSYPWIYSTSYWSGSAFDTDIVWGVVSNGRFGDFDYDFADGNGVRPVIIISKSNF